jgi:Glutaredoxin-related protein
MSAQEKIQNIISSNEVVLFMKGTPDMPQCGFSMAVVNALKHLDVKFDGLMFWKTKK